MRNLISLIALTVIMSGCRIFKSREYSKLEAKSEVRKDSAGLIIDKSVTTIKENIDTIITAPEKIVKQRTSFNMDSLVNGMTAIHNDIMDLRLVLNPVTGILSAEATIKASDIPVKIHRETIKHNDVSQKSNVIEEKKQSNSNASGSSVVQKDSIKIWLYFGVAAILFLVWFSKR